jgi:hypothetical protein
MNDTAGGANVHRQLSPFWYWLLLVDGTRMTADWVVICTEPVHVAAAGTAATRIAQRASIRPRSLLRLLYWNHRIMADGPDGLRNVYFALRHGESEANVVIHLAEHILSCLRV